MTEPFLVHWEIRDGWATSEQIPRVRIPGAPFMGVSAVAPSQEKAEGMGRPRAAARRARRYGASFRFRGRCRGARAALGGLRTLPPRENGGNFDVKQMSTGAKLFLPVFVEGALFSTGDAHFAQGDGEVCVTAIEMGATVAARFKRHAGLAAKRKFQAPVFSREDYFIDPKHAAPQRFLGVMGMPLTPDGENLTLACRTAVLNMMELLQERGFTRNQAYVICSVAVDLRVSNVRRRPELRGLGPTAGGDLRVNDIERLRSPDV